MLSFVISDEYSVTSYECLSVSSDSLLCSWDHPVLPDDYYIEGYQISYRLADGFDYYPGYGTVLNRISLSSMIDQYTVIGLRPYTGYIVVLECIMLHGEFAMDNITSTFSLANVTQPSGMSVDCLKLCIVLFPLFSNYSGRKKCEGI